MHVFLADRAHTQPRVVLATLLLALSGCASELTPAEIADLEAEGPYVGEDEVASSTQALTGVPASIAYFWADNASTPDPYQPASGWSFNSEGGTNTVDRLEANGDGRYRVTLGELSAPGNVQVTAYGNNSNRCNLRTAATNSGGDVRFEVNCHTAQGVPVNSQFVVFYNNTGDTNGKLAMASVSSTGSVSDIANISAASRRAKGRYWVQIPFSSMGIPFVTARNSEPHFCNPADNLVDLDYGGWRVEVRCWDKLGDAVDTAFQFTYMNIPNFTQIETSVGQSDSTSDNLPGGFYSSTNSTRVVQFNYEDPSSLWVRFFWTGVFSRPLSLVNALSTVAVSCKPAGWVSVGGDHFETSVVCHNTSGVASKRKVTNGFFGLAP